MAFLKRAITASITLSSGEFGGGIGSTITLEGHRIGAYIAHAGGEAQGIMECQIYGLSKDLANRLTSIGSIAMENRKNRIRIFAGIEGEKLNLVFNGIIFQSYEDLNNIPDAPLNITAMSSGDIALKPFDATSIKGKIDVVDLMKQIADGSSMSFRSTVPTGTIFYNNPALPNTALEQIKQVARDTNILAKIENNILYIWNYGSDIGDPAVDVNAGNGLVGYASFSSSGSMFKTVFNQDLQLGGLVNINSGQDSVDGIWNIYQLVHSIESNTPSKNSEWFTSVTCFKTVNL